MRPYHKHIFISIFYWLLLLQKFLKWPGSWHQKQKKKKKTIKNFIYIYIYIYIHLFHLREIL